MYVLVVGGGVGGLCLAQGLRRSGIGVAVYERDRSPRVAGQGYRLSLKQAGVAALRACLPENLFELCVATALRPPTRMVFTDEQLTPTLSRPVPAADPGVSGFGINRITLREILLAGLDDVVHFGATFQRYEETGDGRIRAYFRDGTEAEADLLVGADGTGSAVRRQLLPEAVVDRLDRVVYGRTPIADGVPGWLPDLLLDTFNRVTGPDGTYLMVGTCRPREPVGAAAARLASGLRLTPVPDYLSWTLQVPHAAADASPAELHRLAGDLVRGWHPGVRRLIAEADVAATFRFGVHTARPVRPWHTPTVTLLGDAVHTMSPALGEGANAALRDAQALRTALAEAAGGGLAPAKAAYEAEMLRYGFAAVAASLRVGPGRAGG